MRNRIIFICFIVLQLLGCNPGTEIAKAIYKTDAESYDDGICKHGEPSLPGESTRDGCVNNISKEENKLNYYKYKDERDTYLNEK